MVSATHMPPESRAPSSLYRSLKDFETLRTLVHNLNEGIYITSQDGEILDANEAFLRIFGIGSLAELKANYRAEDLYADPQLRGRVKERLGSAGAMREVELEIRRADGTTRTVLDSSYACEDPGTGEVFYHGILVDIEARKELERRLIEASTRDPLTGCFNRRFLDQLAAELSLEGQPWACIYVDLDDFKKYNDTQGHAAGDDAIIAVAHFLMRKVRTTDAVVRMGGDEFLAVIRGVTEFELRRIVKRLQDGASDAATVPFSLGWAEHRGEEAFQDTIQRADKRLLQVRGAGRFAPRRKGEGGT